MTDTAVPLWEWRETKTLGVTRAGWLGSEGKWNMPQNDPAYLSFDGDTVDQNTSCLGARHGSDTIFCICRAERTETTIHR